MPFTGNTYTPPAGATSAATGQIIASATWNAIFTDISTALTQVATRTQGTDGTVYQGVTSGASVFTATPTINTSVTCPLHIGGTGAGSTLTLESTSGVGTTDTILFNTGSQVEALRIDTSQRIITGGVAAQTMAFAVIPRFQLHGIDGPTSELSLCRWQSGGIVVGSTLALCKSGNASIGSHTIIGNSEQPGVIDFAGDDGVKFQSCARINATVDGVPGVNNMPGRLEFRTQAASAGDGVTPTERLRIDSAGKMMLNQGAALLDVFGGSPQLQIARSDSTPMTSYRYYANNSNGPYISFVKSRGAAIGTNVAVTSGDDLMYITVDGYDATGTPVLRESVAIRASADVAPTAGSVGGRLMFLTSASGSASPTERLRIDSTGLSTFTGNVSAPTVITPGVIGGSAANSTLTLESTSGVGTTDGIFFRTGSQVARLLIDTNGLSTFTGNAIINSAASQTSLTLNPLAASTNTGLQVNQTLLTTTLGGVSLALNNITVGSDNIALGAGNHSCTGFEVDYTMGGSTLTGERNAIRGSMNVNVNTTNTGGSPDVVGINGRIFVTANYSGGGCYAQNAVATAQGPITIAALIGYESDLTLANSGGTPTCAVRFGYTVSASSGAGGVGATSAADAAYAFTSDSTGQFKAGILIGYGAAGAATGTCPITTAGSVLTCNITGSPTVGFGVDLTQLTISNYQWRGPNATIMGDGTQIWVAKGTGLASGGTAKAGFMFSSTGDGGSPARGTFGVHFGSNPPTIAAAKGSLYLRSDGTTTNNRAYINTDGSTTWTAITTVA